ncbi:MAG TPA: HAMP domain-containing protein [Oceanospirillales bacterium]|nr:HAMP domain-containing protein [Oceanospirillales bacterium]
MAGKPNKSRSFRAQLTLIFTIGILVLAIASALSSAWITKVHIEDQLFEDGQQITESLAKQSVLALIYDSAENANDAADTAMGFPDIKQLAIINTDNKVILQRGGFLKPTLINGIDKQTVTLLEENINHWIFLAPVFLNSEVIADDTPLLFQSENKKELIGHVLVKKEKSRINEIFYAAIINNIGISLIFSILLLLVIHIFFNRLTAPLHNLAAVMERAEDGEINVYAAQEGPREVIGLARAFNGMIEALAEQQEQLKHHNEILEYEVEERTRDLVYARDMAIKANRNKSDFLSNISHELRTPLQSILGYSDLITELLPQEQQEIQHDVDTIIKNAEHLLHMINSILDMAKVEAGKVNIELKPTDLDQLVTNVSETIKPLMINNGNKFQFSKQLSQNLVNIDADKLRQILLNLLGNAAKFTHNGAVNFDVRQTSEAIYFQVEDNGIGMNRDQVEHIFDPFYQIDAGHTRRYEGTGLGLAITYQFCQLMEGSITVESKEGLGSTFNVIIPVN